MIRVRIATVAAVVVCTLCAPAHSAEMPLKALPAQPIAAASWSGFYIGGDVGYGYGVTGFDIPGFGTTKPFIGFGSKGFSGGGLAGYNVAFAPRWVAGIEVDGSLESIKTRFSTFGATPDVAMSLTRTSSVRGRLGYLLTPTTMVFTTAGWSWSRFSQNLSTNAFQTVSDTINGAEAGFGVETNLTGNWIGRTEFLEIMNHETTFDCGTGCFVKFTPWAGVLRSALIYRMGPDAPTPWTDRSFTPMWSGFYAGAEFGPLISSAKITTPSAPISIDGVGVSAVIPAGLVGYNAMVAPRWIVGVEGAVGPNVSTTDVKLDWNGDVHGRLGYLLTPTSMFYGDVGWGRAEFGGFKPAGAISIPIQRVDAFGWGTGIEAAVSEHWHARVDFNQWIGSSINVALPLGAFATAKPRGETVRLGLIYELGDLVH
jgi:outer membrane immunogenic protein